MSDVQLFSADRKDGKRLVVSWREYQGFHFLDLRVAVLGSDGEYHPTKIGITVKTSELFNVHDAVGRACELAKAVLR